MDVDWTKYHGYFNSTRAFLFSVTNKEKYEMKDKYGIKEDGDVGWFDKTYGLGFGKDLTMNVNKFFGYCDPCYYDFESASKLTGGSEWSCERMEIYAFVR